MAYIGKVRIGCEYSATIRSQFDKLGWDAWSCDILPTEVPGKHIQGDLRDYLHHGWDLLIAHPECTRLCNSGVRWLEERQLQGELGQACAFFMDCWDASIPHICLENPIPHKHAKQFLRAKYTQIINPYEFGHGETKKTCLWLKNLPKLEPTHNVQGREQRIHLMAPSEDRSKERSRTYTGIAEAMATQWTFYFLTEVFPKRK